MRTTIAIATVETSGNDNSSSSVLSLPSVLFEETALAFQEENKKHIALSLWMIPSIPVVNRVEKRIFQHYNKNKPLSIDYFHLTRSPTLLPFPTTLAGPGCIHFHFPPSNPLHSNLPRFSSLPFTTQQYLSSNLSTLLHLLCPLDDNIFHPCVCVHITIG